MPDKLLHRYLSRLRRALPCAPASRRAVMERARALLEDYLAEHPGVGYADLVAAFGAPGDFAADRLEELPVREVAAAQRRRRASPAGRPAASWPFWSWSSPPSRSSTSTSGAPWMRVFPRMAPL